jgi:hypothetical protein
MKFGVNHHYGSQSKGIIFKPGQYDEMAAAQEGLHFSTHSNRADD